MPTIFYFKSLHCGQNSNKTNRSNNYRTKYLAINVTREYSRADILISVLVYAVPLWYHTYKRNFFKVQIRDNNRKTLFSKYQMQHKVSTTTTKMCENFGVNQLMNVVHVRILGSTIPINADFLNSNSRKEMTKKNQKTVLRMKYKPP